MSDTDPVVAEATGLLDKLPAWARHLLLIIAVPAAGVYAQAIVKHDGFVGVDWSGSTRTAVSLAGFSFAAWFVGVFATGLTQQYGTGKR
jgi:hypothetical protein